MSTIRSFKSIRPATQLADKVAALPYDVMNEEEARKMVENNPYSYLHIDRSEVDLPEGTDPHSTEVYELAASNLKKWLDEQTFIQDETPCLYIYKLTADGNSQVGLVCCTSIDEYLNNTIKKHEYTRPEKEDDRVNHVDYCDANTSPIFLTYKTQAEVDEVIEKFIVNNTPTYDFVADDGVGHTVWVIDNQEVCDTLINLFKDIECLYIADGHHRNASALRVGQKRREQNPNFTGEEEFNFYLSVLFPHTQLNILDYRIGTRKPTALAVG
ncbi:MAG: hypothetical protein ATN35_02570 [Epulopiscium sp. Nele67-Bin004]|nr:MAG: hypothetical protein ATN35_02570 [Epulopiscium sp. Nele67-Bin004]